MNVLLLALLVAPRPLLVTVDDLPIAFDGMGEQGERKRATDDMLAALAKHGVHAVGLVTWKHVKGPADVELLNRWLEAGHELGNHSQSHLDYTTTGIDPFVTDIEAGRKKVQGLLDRRKQKLRFFRFPFLREGDTNEKLVAMRSYLEKSGQKNLPVTIDTQDWSFEEHWLGAVHAAEAERQQEIASRYQASLQGAVLHYTSLGDKVVGSEAPQIILLHATAIGGAQWDALFTWIEKQGFRFATADEVLAHPAFAMPHTFVGPRGFSLWDRVAVDRRTASAKSEIAKLLDQQAADWTRGDLEAFCSVYTEDATFISPSGVTLGRRAILDRYRKKWPGKKMGALSLAVIETRIFQGWEVSRAGDAIPSKMHGASTMLRWTVRYPEGEPVTGLSMITLVPKETGGWSIAQDASM